MQSFSIHFLICNIFIAIIIGIFLVAKQIFKNQLSGRTRYNLWFSLPVLLAVPFLSFRPRGVAPFFFWIKSLKTMVPYKANMINQTATAAASPTATGWMNDFSVSVTREAPSALNYLFWVIWLLGILAMILFMAKSWLRLHRIEKSALPLQNQKVQKLFKECKLEMNLKRNIPIYSTAFLKSPVLVGLFKPRIYMPIHLISDFNATNIRYMLLHELQHYRHKDSLASYLMNLAAIIYWFNPSVLYALKEMRTDREVACDSSVLQMLNAEDYVDYGNTLLNFAEKLSLSPFSLVSEIGGSAKQIKKRILNITSYHPETSWNKIKGYLIFLLITILCLESTNLIPVLAKKDNVLLPSTGDVIYEDLTAFFPEYDGCFVLYDQNADTWQIYNKSLATQRVSPDSTYKIYSALFALENQYITPFFNTLDWNGQKYSISEWNQKQTLTTALQNSVNWYFQTLDQKADLTELNQFYKKIGYGNHDLSGGISNFWLESSLKISPLEQVELLKKLYTNEFHFQKQNVQTVKSALMLSSSNNGALYGKTGTGKVNGQNINGWFIGYIESAGNTYFFATNIRSDANATGAAASEITLDILKEKNIYY